MVWSGCNIEAKSAGAGNADGSVSIIKEDRSGNALLPDGLLRAFLGATFMTTAFTVIGVHAGNGQIVCHHVMANDGLHAFAVAAPKVDSDLNMVVALDGHLTEGGHLTFPGEGMVDVQTVLDQPEVFGNPSAIITDGLPV
jgi:hypothetical protein